MRVGDRRGVFPAAERPSFAVDHVPVVRKIEPGIGGLHKGGADPRDDGRTARHLGHTSGIACPYARSMTRSVTVPERVEDIAIGAVEPDKAAGKAVSASDHTSRVATPDQAEKIISPNQATDVAAATDRARRVALRDCAVAVIPDQAADIVAATDRARRVALLDHAPAAVIPDQAADIVAATDRARRVTLRDRAAKIAPDQAADIGAAHNLTTLEPEICDCRAVGIAEQTDVIGRGPVDGQASDDMTKAVKRAGERG